MVKDLAVTRSLLLNAPAERVWEALTHPKMTNQYMFNCEVESNWAQKGEITWKGKYQGEEIFQRGEIVDIVPGKLLHYTTFDPHSGEEDAPENYVHVRYELTPMGHQTRLVTTLENFGGDELRAEHAALAWDLEVLPRLKSLIETTL